MSLRPIPSRPASTYRPADAQAPTAAVAPVRLQAPTAQAAGGTTARQRALAPAGFRIERNGPFPPKVAGGFWETMKQNWNTVKLTNKAAESQASGGRMPSDGDVASTLRGLRPMPVVGSARDVTHVRYTSTARNVSPDRLFRDLVENPEAIFSAAGLGMRPLPAKLENGQRFMLEDQGVPPVWFPMEVRLDAAARRVELVCLDGHPFRGSNAFQFVDDGAGGTRVVQDSVFQAASNLSWVGFNLFNAAERQEQGWASVHGVLAERAGALDQVA
jgi:hypothetical protein